MQMQMCLRALELHGESQSREMWGNIAEQALSLGGQLLSTYLDYKFGDDGRERSMFIPIPYSRNHRSLGGGSSFPGNALPWHMHFK